MDYQIYIPGCRGSSPDHLERVGLGDLIEPGKTLSACEVTAGPDKGQGTIFFWGEHSRPGFHKEEQLWTPCKPRGVLPPGRFWMGQQRGDRPQPSDLLRTGYLGGEPIQLADGQLWLVPVTRTLPHEYVLDDLTGAPKREVKKAYGDWLNVAQSYFDLIIEWRRSGEGRELTIPEAFLFAVKTLQFNYRINADILGWLGLIDDVSMLALIAGVFEISALSEIEAQKKKAALSAHDI